MKGWDSTRRHIERLIKVSKEEVVKETKLAFMLLNRRQFPNSRYRWVGIQNDVVRWFTTKLVPAQSATLWSSAAALEKNLEANEYPLLQLLYIIPYEIPHSLCCLLHSVRCGVSQHNMQSSLHRQTFWGQYNFSMLLPKASKIRGDRSRPGIGATTNR